MILVRTFKVEKAEVESGIHYLTMHLLVLTLHLWVTALLSLEIYPTPKMGIFMKLLIGLLVSFTATAPAKANPELDKALARVPSLTDLCGAVPIAPAKVRGNSIHYPVRRSVKTFVVETNDWLECASQQYVRIQGFVDDMRDDWQRSVLVDHLNKDFQTHFSALNNQTEALAQRVNYRLTWLERPLRPAVASTGAGLSNSKANVLLRKTKRLTYKADINRPFYNPSRHLLKWEPVEPFQFQG